MKRWISFVMLLLLCLNLFSFSLLAESTQGTTSDGFEYLVKNGTATVLSYIGTETAVTIPNMVDGTPVTAIGKSAFEGIDILTSIVIPEGIVAIVVSAFEDCVGLTSITLPNSVIKLGSSAFSGCSGLTSVTLPSGIDIIGDSLFYECTGLTSVSIPTGVEIIDVNAFYGCTALASIEIPEGVTSIGSSAFNGCSSLTSITLPDSVTTIEREAFVNTGYYNNQDNWKYGMLYIGNHLIKVNDIYLGACSVKEGTKTIGEATFSNCTGITSVKLPDSINTIGDSAFNECSGLTGINIPKGVTTIDSLVFYNCKALTSITIPEGVTSIGFGAFYGCDALNIISVPDSVNKIGDNAFEDTGYFNNVENWENDMLYIGNHLIKMNGTVCYVKEGTKTIAGGAAGINLQSVTIPGSVVTINEGAFTDYDGAEVSYSSVTTVTIEHGVTTIDDSAFSHCAALESIVIPDSVTTIGSGAFYGCTSLDSIILPDSISSIGSYAFVDTAYYKNSENWDNEVLYIGNHLIAATENISGHLKVKDGTKTIGGEAFLACADLTSIDIPNSVVFVGEYAFLNCENLVSVTIPPSVITICDSALTYCFYEDGYLPIYQCKILGAAGSEAETYAKKLGMVFEKVLAADGTLIQTPSTNTAPSLSGQSQPQQEDDHKGFSLVLIIAGGVILVGVIGLVLFFCLRKKKKACNTGDVTKSS